MNKHRFSIALGTIGLALTFSASAAAAAENFVSSILRSTAATAAGCLPMASGRVTMNSSGPVESLHVEILGLPPNIDFDLFVIQLPDKPFGLAC